MDKKTLFDEAKSIICKNFNSNVYWDRLAGPEQVWIRVICELTEKRIKELETEIKEKVIII